jgi:O-antigen/teichoic acid export membrane protein
VKGNDFLRDRVSEEVLESAIALAVPDTSFPVNSVPASIWARATSWSRGRRAGAAIRAGGWSIAGYSVTQGLRTLATLVLARHFLGPEPFGLVGLVAVFVAGLSMFSELGLLANVVQHSRGDNPQFLNTAFSIQAGRGLCIWLAALLIAYPASLFYKQPILFPLLAVAGLSEMVRGLTSTAAFTLNRRLQLREITILLITSEVFGSGIAILWAVFSPSAWALVARTITSAAVYAIGSHFIATPSVRFGWDRPAAKDILHFGGWISISTAAYFLGGQGERLILGKFITPGELGCFSLALMICTLPGAAVTQLIGQIFLPMISEKVRTTRSGTADEFLKARKICFVVAVIAGVGFLTLGKPAVGLLLNSKYAMTGWMLQLLGIRVAFDIFSSPASNLILAYGRTKYSAAGNTTRLIVMASGVWIAFQMFGLKQAIVTLVLAQALSYFPLLAGIRRLLPELARSELRWYAGLLTLLIIAAVLCRAGA